MNNEKEGEELSESRELVIRSEQTGLSFVSQDPLTRRVGITPKFIAHLGDLNEVLTRRASAGVNEFDLTMIPGQVPIINTQLEVSGGARVGVKVRPNTDRCSIIITNPKFDIYSLMLRLSDMQVFMQKHFENGNTRLRSESNKLLVPRIPDMDVDLYKVKEGMVKNWSELKRRNMMIRNEVKVNGATSYSSFEVQEEGITDPIFSFDIMRVWYDKENVGCSVKRFYWEGQISESEEVLEDVVDLFDKPFEYPFIPPQMSDL